MSLTRGLEVGIDKMIETTSLGLVADTTINRTAEMNRKETDPLERKPKKLRLITLSASKAKGYILPGKPTLQSA